MVPRFLALLLLLTTPAWSMRTPRAVPEDTAQAPENAHAPAPAHAQNRSQTQSRDLADSLASQGARDLMQWLDPCPADPASISCAMFAMAARAEEADMDREGRNQMAKGAYKISKRMVLPLLVGVLLKVASFVPLILGKLSLVALASIAASKMALLISAVIGTRKLYAAHAYGDHEHYRDHGGSDSSLSPVLYDGHGSGVGHGGYGAFSRRVAPAYSQTRTLSDADPAAVSSHGWARSLSLGSDSVSADSQGASADARANEQSSYSTTTIPAPAPKAPVRSRRVANTHSSR